MKRPIVLGLAAVFLIGIAALTWDHPDDILFQVTQNGPEVLVGGNYRRDTPAFENVLNDREIADAVTHIKSTWPELIRIRHDAKNSGGPHE